MSSVKNVRDSRINLRVSDSVDLRVDHLAELIGLPKSAVAATALVMGLRILETNIIGQTIDADTLATAQRKLYDQMGHDVEANAIELAKSPPVEKPGVGFRPRGDLDELTVWVPRHGYMAGL